MSESASSSLSIWLHSWKPIYLTQIVLSPVLNDFIVYVGWFRSIALARMWVSDGLALFLDLILSFIVGWLTHNFRTDRLELIRLLPFDSRIVSAVPRSYHFLYVIVSRSNRRLPWFWKYHSFARRLFPNDLLLKESIIIVVMVSELSSLSSFLVLRSFNSSSSWWHDCYN